MKLKQYQAATRAVVRRCVYDARVAGPKNAYEASGKEPGQAKRLGRYAGDYRPLAALPGIPYVCLRLPTGGGKTILGTHAVGIVRDAWVEKDYPLVLRSEEHTSELQSLMRISYAVFCLKKKK